MLALDAYAGEISRSLRAEGVRCIVLKGPTVVGWLYDDEQPRSYVDIDLLVSESDRPAAASVLSAEGFAPSGTELALPHGRRPHAETWVRDRDGMTIDLHDTVAGVGVTPSATWDVLAQEAEPMTLAGAQVEVLTKSARALLIALHAAHHGVKDAQTMGDLTRALARIDEATWQEAAELAERLEATAPFAAGLRLTDDGARLAERLALPFTSSVESILRSGSAPELALSFDWLLRTQGTRARAQLVLRRLAPRPSVLRGRSSLARRGVAGLGLAYLLQPLRLSVQSVPALRAWLAARRRAS
jgi:hypothetical protein